MGAKRTQYSTTVNFAVKVAVGVAFLLSCAKYFAWHYSGSFTVQASLLDSLSDFFSSLINLCAVRYATKPANEKYKFGHGKAEALAGFVQAILIMFSASWIVYRAFVSTHVAHSFGGETNLVLLLMSSCSIITLSLVLFQKHIIKKTNSVAIMSDHLHYKGDLLSDMGAIIAVVAGKYFAVLWLDSFLSLIISAILFKGCFGILKNSFNILMDRELSDETLSAILNTISMHKHVQEVHDLRTRSCGVQEFVQVHISLDPNLSLSHAHTIGDEVENLLLDLLPNAQVLIHLDPFEIETNTNYRMK